jgi:hypothetical protein
MVSYGYDFTRPRTQINLNSSALGSANVLSEKPIILIGSAKGGKPQVPFQVTNFAQAKEIFRGGELLDAIEMAWNPSPNSRGAGTIFAMRSDGATQAQLVSGAATFKSNIYGIDANGIQIQYLDSATAGAKKVEVIFNAEQYDKVYDNIGIIFNLQYVGSQASGLVEVLVDGTTKLATTLNLKAGPAGTETIVRSYLLGDGLWADINTVVNDIDNLPDWTGTMNVLGGNKDVATKNLDALTATPCKSAAVPIKAVGADLVNQLANDPYVTVTVDPKLVMPTTIALTFLSGGTTTAAPVSWSTLFSQVGDVGAYYIVPLTSTASIHGELSQFLRDQSGGGNQLRGFVGGGLNETQSQIQARQVAIRNSRVSLVGNSGSRTMSDGRVLNIAGYMFAALVAGLASGLAVGEPITFKRVLIEGLDVKFTSDQLDQLDANGIVMVEFIRTRNGSYFRIVSDPTTYNVATDPVQNRISLGETSDFLTTELRTMLDEAFIGTKLRNTSASIIKNAIESFLDQQKNVGGLIVNYNPDDVQVVITGNSARINLTVQPAQGLDYINVFVTYQDVNLSA